MEDASAGLNSKAVIQAAFGEFQSLFPRVSENRVLLEGLEFLEREGRWSVVIGFDTERTKHDSRPSEIAPKVAALKSYKKLFEETETVREFRRFIVDGTTGLIVRMERA